MDITPTLPSQALIINAYGAGGFRVGGAPYTGSVLVMPRAVSAWKATESTLFEETLLLPCIEAAQGEVELLLIGTGVKAITRVPAPLTARLRERGIGVSAMDTGAACRTYNVLLTEGRKVAAALLAV